MEIKGLIVKALPKDCLFFNLIEDRYLEIGWDGRNLPTEERVEILQQKILEGEIESGIKLETLSKISIKAGCSSYIYTLSFNR